MVTLFIEQHEYIKALSPAAGVRVLIHHQYQQPFPEEDGFDISPGQKTTVALRMVSSYYKYLNPVLFALYFYLCFSIRYSYDFGDGPFDIQGGGGWDFSSPQVIFFLFLQNKLFFSKVNSTSFFIFFEKQHIKIRKM